MMRTFSTPRRLGIILISICITMGLFSCGKDDPVGSKSSEKKIKSFVINTLSPAATGTINEETKTISVIVLAGTDLKNLVPTISVSDKASISPSSGLAQDFTAPVVYTVTAEDGSTAKYTVTVNSGTATTLPDNISENTTLKDLGLPVDYVVEGILWIDGNAQFKIEPGVTIMFASSHSRIIIGDNAGLIAKGTPDKHITFRGPLNNNTKGSFSGIEIRSNRSDNVMEFVDIINAGSDSDDGVLKIAYEAKLKMSNCLIDGSLSYGVRCNDGVISEFKNNIIKNCDKAPIISGYLLGVIAIDGSNKFESNKQNIIIVENSHGNKTESTLNNIGIPWQFESGYFVENVFTIQAGAKLIFDIDRSLVISDKGAIVAKGTADKPISFVSTKNKAGAWKGIKINTRWDNILENCIIDGGGADDNEGNLYIHEDAVVTLNKNTFSNSSNYGISRFQKDGDKVKGSGNIFTNCAKGNVFNREDESKSDNL